MTDAEFEAQKARVQALIEKWVKPLGLGWWRIEFDYHREGLEGIRPENKGKWDTVFQLEAQWMYFVAYVKVSMPAIKDLDDKELEHSFVHELAHIFINEMRQNCDDWLDHEERVATTLANAFIWLRDAVQKEAKGEA